MTSKYIDYIKGVADGTITESLNAYLQPEIKDTKWFKKQQEISRNNTLIRIELSRRSQ